MQEILLNPHKVRHLMDKILMGLILIVTFSSTKITHGSYLDLSFVRAKQPTKPITSSYDTVPPVIVVSTTVPNVEDSVIREKVANEARRQKTLEREIVAKVEERNRIIQEELERRRYADYINSISCDPMDVSKVSGLKLEDFHLLTEGTWWEGNEQALYDLEQTYGVNAMFAMSVSTLESGRGTSVRASSRHNYYGIELPNMRWDSLYDNTQYWGDLISHGYNERGLKSVWAIGPVYCPPNRQWEVYMNDKMTELYSSLLNKLNDTVK